MPQLSFDTHGNPARPAIMLLHGFMSCNAQWMPNLDALSRSHFLVMVELWGHGKSPTPSDPEAYSIARYVREFERIRAQLGIDIWHLIGQSYGAGLVLHYAHEFPQCCKAVVTTNSRSAFGRVGRERKSPPSEPAPADFNPRRYPFHPIHARRVPAEVKAAMVASADAMSSEAIRLSGLLGSKLGASHLLGELGGKVLVINGIYEKAFQDDIERLRVKHAKLNVADLEGGHSVNIDAAEAFHRAVLAFLADG